jgi:hypothetical protein
VVGAIFLSGCSLNGAALDVYSGAPDGMEVGPQIDENDIVDFVPQAIWLTEGETFALVLYGSSGCPRTVESATMNDDREIQLAVSVPRGFACPLDIAPTTYELAVPDDYSSSATELRIHFEEESLPEEAISIR